MNRWQNRIPNATDLMAKLTPNSATDEVRKPGSTARASVDQALAWLDEQLKGCVLSRTETIPFSASYGRVLAEPVTSSVNVPNFGRAMMDGFALRSTDIVDAAAEEPAALNIVGTRFPGECSDIEVRPGEAIRIMTGAALPPGVDAVLPVEQTRTTGDTLLALASVPTGKHCGRIGEDVASGDAVFEKGRRLRAQDIGLLSAIGQGTVSVVRRPRVRIVVTGNELLPAGETPRGNHIVDSNGPMLQTLVERDGGELQFAEIVPDDREAILAAIGEDADIVITAGGSSVGQEDHLTALVEARGELAIHGVAMRPGGPTSLGICNDQLMILLSGNPAACLWGYDLFAGRAVRALGWSPKDFPYERRVCKLRGEVMSKQGRTDYVRVQVSEDEAEPMTGYGASVLSAACRADGFLVIPDIVQRYSNGEHVDVFHYA